MSIEPTIIAITGKGGVGKTTFTGLMLKSLLNIQPKKILVIDADPATNLADILGIPSIKTVGQIVDTTKYDVEKKSESYNASALLEFRLWEEALIENPIEDPRFHFLAMGYTTGRGCYCVINDILTYMLENIKSYYDIVLLDMDAGLEHISRNTKRPINLTILLTDPSRMGFQTVRRIIELSRELESPIEKFLLVGNMFVKPISQKKLQNLAHNLHIPLLGIMPLDKLLAQMNLKGEPLLNIPIDSLSYQKVNQMIKKLSEEINLF